MRGEKKSKNPPAILAVCTFQNRILARSRVITKELGFSWYKKFQVEEVITMTINDFAIKMTEHEGKKVQVNIAQMKEILKVINVMLGGALYKAIKAL